jgi:regulator of replication initiation timing
MTALGKTFSLPDQHDGCPIRARTLALEGRMDIVEDEVHTTSAEVKSLSLDIKAMVERSSSMNVEMGTQLKRMAEYTCRNTSNANDIKIVSEKVDALTDIVRSFIKSSKPKKKR